MKTQPENMRTVLTKTQISLTLTLVLETKTGRKTGKHEKWITYSTSV